MPSLRSFIVVMVLVTGCAPRVIKLPVSPRPAKVGTFALGVNGSAKVLDYQAAPSGRTTGRAKGLKIGGFGKENSAVASNVTVSRGALPSFTVACERRLSSASFRSARHGLSCAAEGVAITVDEPTADDFRGAVRIGQVDFELQSTDELEGGGIPQRPTGFHLRRAGRWLGSFEYVQQGDVYLAPDLSADERDAVLIAMVVVQSTDRFFALDK